jgi:hypothetical protein
MRTLAAIAASALLVVTGCAPGSGGSSTGATSGPAPSGAEALVGSWQTTITKDDLRGGGITEAGLLNENSGIFTWTFRADGVWTNAQMSQDGSAIDAPVFRGTYWIEGDTLVAVTEFPSQYRDAGLHYHWHVTGQQLVVDLLDPPDPTAALIAELHPWVRVPD